MTAASRQGLSRFGDSLAWVAMAAVTAVDEVSPPTRPVRLRPRSAPRNLVRKYPTKLIPEIRINQEHHLVGVEGVVDVQRPVGQQRQDDEDDARNFRVSVSSTAGSCRSAWFMKRLDASSAVMPRPARPPCGGAKSTAGPARTRPPPISPW